MISTELKKLVDPKNECCCEYHLAQKCKEWALSKGYQFKVYIQTNGEEEWQVGKCGYGWDLFTCKSIQEACEYIMEEENEKQ